MWILHPFILASAAIAVFLPFLQWLLFSAPLKLSHVLGLSQSHLAKACLSWLCVTSPVPRSSLP